MYNYVNIWMWEKAVRRRIDAFELWWWRRFLGVPWTARGSNQSILKEISPGYSLEGMMLKLKLQYFGHLMRRVDSLDKTLTLGGIGGRRRRGWQEDEMAGWHHWLDGFVWVNSGSWWWTGRPGVLHFMGSQRVGRDWVTELNWTELNQLGHHFAQGPRVGDGQGSLAWCSPWVAKSGTQVSDWTELRPL